MTDSSSFTSLLALVDSHLSKTTVSGTLSEGTGVPIPSLTEATPGTLSDTRLTLPPIQRLPIPRFNLGNSPIQNALAEQVANMLKAKEQKQKEEEEKQRVVEEMKRIKLEEDNDVIDLMPALQTKEQMIITLKARQSQAEVASTSSSLESLFEPKFIDSDGKLEIPRTPEPLLPCITDMSYILHQKIRKGKCSAFGRVLTARLKPVAAPYLREKIESNIVIFKFDTPSPCDVILEKLRRPTRNATYYPDIVNFV